MGTFAEKLNLAAEPAQTGRTQRLKAFLLTALQLAGKQLTGGRRARAEMSVVKVLSVGQKASVAMLEIKGGHLLLGVTSTSVTLLKEFGLKGTNEVQAQREQREMQ